jgi:hypothetical protein
MARDLDKVGLKIPSNHSRNARRYLLNSLSSLGLVKSISIKFLCLRISSWPAPNLLLFGLINGKVRGVREEYLFLIREAPFLNLVLLVGVLLSFVLILLSKELILCRPEVSYPFSSKRI